MSRIAIVTTMRNEAPHLLEWIAHHRAAGVDDFLVFSNDCSDGTDTMLDLLGGAGVVHHIRNPVPDGRTPQWSALRLAARHPVHAAADWIAVMDCDEFINLRAPGGGLPGLIDRCAADAIVLPWRLFGHGGHAMPPDQATRRAFRRAIAPDALYPPLSRFFKTLYRRAAFAKPGVHRPKPGDRTVRWVDGSGRALPDGFASAANRIMLWGDPLATGLVQLNHYSLRSAGDFLLKQARGLPNHTDKAIDLTYWIERNFNTVEDRSIDAMAAATDAEFDRLLALPGVAAAQKAARTTARARIDAMLESPDTAALFGRLLLAADSVPPDDATARRLVALYQRALSLS
ncbi:glycosyltransferase family 2 protein [Oceaniglobus indicus]|uniref:glycosyltransferase family 2 protein n=1 Tax=Oceaniglobus indicus TaxID=2047749 RepID=UPI000C19DADC|nr:glycosyltransferase family 2 protein [Oceaniglobus indicus]